MKINYINKPSHAVTIAVIGAGGNGSQMITQLGRINHALLKLNHPGLHVVLFDSDKVSESNIGRQLFTEAEIGEYKSVVLISRINRFYGTEWEGVAGKVTSNYHLKYNIIITCTDNVASRNTVHKTFKERTKTYGDSETTHYWLDMGNTKTTGQVILSAKEYKKSGTAGKIVLPTVVDRYPKLFSGKIKEDNSPSCSLAEALAKQDLFVNTFVTNVAAKLLWEMLRQSEVNYCGAYINLDTLNIKKIAA